MQYAGSTEITAFELTEKTILEEDYCDKKFSKR